ncbi:MAG: pitrilysin family protein [Vicinamibacterales bacterium]
MDTRVNGTLTAIVCLALSVITTAAWQAPAAPTPRSDAPPVWAPAITKARLSNGLPVWVVEQHELPVVQMSLVVRSGTAADPPAHAGIASLTAALLTAGAGGRSAVAFADELDRHVANLSASTTADASLLRVYVPADGLAAVLPLMADAALRPAFPDAAVDGARRQRLDMLRGVRDDPDALVALAFARGLYGAASRNAAPQIGSVASLESTSAADVQAFHRAAYRPANSTMLVVGAVTADDVLPLLERHFGSWRAAGGPGAAEASTADTQPPARQLLLADVPRAPQARVLVGGVSRASAPADYFPIQILTAVLRGRFSEPRTPALREYTTGVRPGFDRRRSGGPLAVTMAVQGHKAAEALAELLGELADALKGVSASELARAKREVAAEFAQTFDATGRISSRLQALEALVTFDLPDDTYVTYADRIDATSADDVLRVAAQYLDPAHLVIAMAGDRADIEPRLTALGLGTPVAVDVDTLFGARK